MKQDRRVQKTEHLYQEALLQLLQEKAITDISITELTEKAHLHRATFYTHYDSICDVLLSIEQGLLDTLEYICRFDESVPDGSYIVLKHIFKFLETNREIMKIFFIKDIHFVTKMKTLVRQFALRYCQYIYGANRDHEYALLCDYMIEGMMYIFKEWVYGTQEGSASTMAHTLQRIMLFGMNSLER